MDGDTNDPITLCLQIILNFTCSSASQPSSKLLIQLPAVTQCNRMSTYARKTVLNWKLINFSFCPESEQLKRANYKCEFSELKSAQRCGNERRFCGIWCTCDSQKKRRLHKSCGGRIFLLESFRTCCTLPQRHHEEKVRLWIL